MNILMMTNTFTPHVGGVARSVERFTREYRDMGHRVLVVAPEFEDMPEEEEDVIRVPAIQNFNGSDFSVMLPLTGLFRSRLLEFGADVVHAHHPFLVGSVAVRFATQEQLPLVFTHHTMYDRYTHYVPGDSPRMKRFVISLSTGFANLCDAVIAPSESIAAILRERGVKTPIESIPTGVRVEQFEKGDGRAFRARHRIPPDAFVIGHVGRLAPEKNLVFLSEAVAALLSRESDARFLVIGGGPSEEEIVRIFSRTDQAARLHLTGPLRGQDLVDGYHAMDIFAFASRSETQGMVLAESMAAGVPVVALDAPGCREVVRDGVNGRLVMEKDARTFTQALGECMARGGRELEAMRAAARRTAGQFSLERCAARHLDVYRAAAARARHGTPLDDSPWRSALDMVRTEWDLLRNVTQSIMDAMGEPAENEPPEEEGTPR